MSASRRATLLLFAAALCAAASVLILPVFLGPLALLASAGAIWSGARRPGAVLLFVSAGAMAVGMYLGCRVACA
ncbi:MAG TPA: hypothetical protein VFA01_05890 [Candidatus Dormibacteraeota bacterium]|nr:hypothetical protein [Candidatus Dormibacteraeota bacterium]